MAAASAANGSAIAVDPRHAWMDASVPTKVGTHHIMDGVRSLSLRERDLTPVVTPVGRYAPDSSGFTRNHAAYNAGRNTRVSTVPTIRPPMIEIAIEP